jgi:hypothetical protein
MYVHVSSSEYRRKPKPKDRFVENVSKLICLGTTLTNGNCFREEIWSALTSGNACNTSFQNLLSSVCF